MHAVKHAGVAQAVCDRKPDMVILGPSVACPRDMMEMTREIRRLAAVIPMVITSRSTEELAIAALRAGVKDYIKFPLHADELAEAVRRCVRQSTAVPKTPQLLCPPKKMAGSWVSAQRCAK